MKVLGFNQLKLHTFQISGFNCQPAPLHHGAELIHLDERHGFAHALRRGLMHVRTPHVLVAQHDRSFVRNVSLAPVLDAMEASDGLVQYVGFPTSSTIDHR